MSGAPFIADWRRVFNDTPLPSTQKLVGLVLSIYANGDGTEAWPSIATLARDCSLAERSVQYALRGLERVGFVHARRGGGRGKTTVYDLTLPAVNGARGAPIRRKRVQLTTEKGAPGAPDLDQDLERGKSRKSTRRSGLPRTGWRLARGSHGTTYVPDPEGTDRPPRYYA